MSGKLSRFILELSFMILIVWLIYQTVSGLIVDTFCTLRHDLEEYNNYINEYCYICNMEREKIEKIYTEKFGFSNHLKDHNLKNYFLFLFYLKEKREDNLSGVERYVKSMIKKSKHDWIPNETCYNIYLNYNIKM